jgi:hypothetical protein
MGLIEYFRKLKERFFIRKQFSRESRENFYTICKEGIFSFFEPYLTNRGFYLNLRDKLGLMNFLENNSSNSSTIKNTKLNEPQRTNSIIEDSFQKKAEEYTKPAYGAFERMVKYFKEFPKENLGKYSSLSFHYRPFLDGCTTSSHGNKLEFLFG